VPFLGELPLIQSIRESGDAGRPAVLQEQTLSSRAFQEIIRKFVSELQKHSAHANSLKDKSI
jgi:ATP-binding protein involved in chromosome partitioning